MKQSGTRSGSKRGDGNRGLHDEGEKVHTSLQSPQKAPLAGRSQQNPPISLEKKSERAAQAAFPHLLAGREEEQKVGNFPSWQRPGRRGGLERDESADSRFSQLHRGYFRPGEGRKEGPLPPPTQPRHPPVPARSPNDAMAPDSAAGTRLPPSRPPPSPRGENAAARQGPVRPWRAHPPRLEPRLLRRARLWRQGRRVAAGRERGGGRVGRCQAETRAPRPALSHLSLSLPESTRFSKWRVLSRGEGSGKTAANQRRRGEGGRGGGRGERAARAERGWGEGGALRPCAAGGALTSVVTSRPAAALKGGGAGGVWEGRALTAQMLLLPSGPVL